MLFPELPNKRFKKVDLDQEAQLWLAKRERTVANPLLDPQTCQQFIEECHRRIDTDFSYGGWLESRNTLWRGSYLDADERYVHLGIDFNVPVGTGVAVSKPSIVLRIDNDYPEPYGWGNRVISQDVATGMVLIYAHLAEPIPLTVGDTLKPGEIFTRVGTPNNNGGWFPHLHLQAVNPRHYQELLKSDLRDLDGYAKTEDIGLAIVNFPNPMAFAEGLDIVAI